MGLKRPRNRPFGQTSRSDLQVRPLGHRYESTPIRCIFDADTLLYSHTLIAMEWGIMNRPRGLSESQLKNVGITIEDPIRIWLRCDKCGAAWSPNIQRGGGLLRGYWKCPNSCNSKKRV